MFKVKCKAIVKSCKKYGISNFFDGSKEEALFGGRKVQETEIRMCSVAVFKGFYDQYKFCTVLSYYCVYIFSNLSFKRKENGWGGGDNAIPMQAWKGP
jgi:hypothetical protein